ncbi:putative THO complex subunit 2 protein [Helianthus debilis subsp. tardiflorus]
MSLPALECKYVTDECIREWKNGSSTFKPPAPAPVLRYLYELCWNIVRGELPIQKCKSALELVEFSDRVSDDEVASNLADIVSQMAQDLTMPGEYRARLIKLVVKQLNGDYDRYPVNIDVPSGITGPGQWSSPPTPRAAPVWSSLNSSNSQLEMTIARVLCSCSQDYKLYALLFLILFLNLSHDSF